VTGVAVKIDAGARLDDAIQSLDAAAVVGRRRQS